MTILPRWCLLVPLALGVTGWGQELGVPSSWVKSTTAEASRDERVNRAAEAIDAFIASDSLFTSIQPPSNLSDSYWPRGEILALIADFDIFTNQTRYKRIAQQRFLAPLQQTTPKHSRYGYAATRAYLAYQDEAFLNLAKEYWASNRTLTLSDADVQARSSPAKSRINSNTSLACSKPGSEYTLAGGTFHSTDQSDLLITTGATSTYLTLTASLASILSNLDPTYINLASEMGHFILTALYKGSGLFYDNFAVGSLDCPNRGDDNGLAVGGVAHSMRGLSLLALNSNSSDQRLMNVIRDITLHATGSAWNSADGVLDPLKFPAETRQNTNEFSQVLLRSYFDAVVGDGIPDLKAYLRAYLAVQYDVLVSQASFTSGAPHFYGVGLRPERQLNVEAQIVAITMLLGGVISGNDTKPDDLIENDSEDHSPTPIGAIVGGVVGGVLGLVLVVAGSYCYLRRRRQSQPDPLTTMEPYPAMSMNPPMPLAQSPPAPTLVPLRSSKYNEWVPPASPTTSSGIGSTASAPKARAPESQSSRVHEATTAELVTLLNQRLRNERWDENESPPEYHRIM
ncbi:hypothetical protein PQX77_015245 [Marasmius sp. AFHP31]|nr:hypothetical protein PQX77_015245 [Marasmius sp. AFHP31]